MKNDDEVFGAEERRRANAPAFHAASVALHAAVRALDDLYEAEGNDEYHSMAFTLAMYRDSLDCILLPFEQAELGKQVLEHASELARAQVCRLRAEDPARSADSPLYVA